MAHNVHHQPKANDGETSQQYPRAEVSLFQWFNHRGLRTLYTRKVRSFEMGSKICDLLHFYYIYVFLNKHSLASVTLYNNFHKMLKSLSIVPEGLVANKMKSYVEKTDKPVSKLLRGKEIRLSVRVAPEAFEVQETLAQFLKAIENLEYALSKPILGATIQYGVLLPRGDDIVKAYLEESDKIIHQIEVKHHKALEIARLQAGDEYCIDMNKLIGSLWE